MLCQYTRGKMTNKTEQQQADEVTELLKEVLLKCSSIQIDYDILFAAVGNMVIQLAIARGMSLSKFTRTLEILTQQFVEQKIAFEKKD